MGARIMATTREQTVPLRTLLFVDPLLSLGIIRNERRRQRLVLAILLFTESQGRG